MMPIVWMTGPRARSAVPGRRNGVSPESMGTELAAEIVIGPAGGRTRWPHSGAREDMIRNSQLLTRTTRLIARMWALPGAVMDRVS